MPQDPVAQRCLREAAAAVPELSPVDPAAAESPRGNDGHGSGCVRASRISGGISNHLFLVCRPGCETQVLVRLYGADEPLCDRSSEESLVQLLSARGFGPTVLRVFSGGRVELYWPFRRPLIPAESLKREPVDFAAMVARRLAELHGLKLAVPGRASAEEQLSRWFAAVDPGGPIDRSELQAAIDGVGALRPTATTAAEREVERALTERTLCHLDLFAANLMFGSDRELDSQGDAAAREGETGDKDIQFIDYEYAADAYIGLDIANHMSGCTELIEGESVTFDTSFYPTSEQQSHFLGVYLDARGLGAASQALSVDRAAGEFAERLLVAFAAEAECRWVVWGLLQRQLSTVPFDFADYALQRWACFKLYQEWATKGVRGFGTA